jgi:hypothetical protein
MVEAGFTPLDAIRVHVLEKVRFVIRTGRVIRDELDSGQLGKGSGRMSNRSFAIDTQLTQ